MIAGGEQRPGRVRHVAAAVAVAALAVVVASGTAVAGSAGAVTPVSLAQLQGSFQQTQTALAQRQQLEMARLRASWAKQIADRQAQGNAQVAALGQQLAQALVPLNAPRADVETRRQAALAAAGGQYAVKRQNFQALIAGTAPPAGSTPLSGNAATAVVNSVQQQLNAAQSSISGAAASDVSALQSALGNAQTQASAARAVLVANQKVDVSQLQSDYQSLVDQANAELADTLQQLATEQSDLDADYQASFAATKQDNAVELAAAKAARTSGSDLQTLQSNEQGRLDALTNLYKSQSQAISDEGASAKSANQDDLTSLKSDYDAQIANAKNTATLSLRQFDAATALTVLLAQQAVADRQALAKEQADDANAVFALSQAAQLRDPKRFASAAGALLAQVDQQAGAAANRINGEFDQQSDKVNRKADADVALASAPYQVQIGDANDETASDVEDLQHARDAAVAGLQRRQQLERLLATTDYQIMRARTAAYLGSGAASLTPLDNFYDPASDPGSLYNVARTLGIDDKTPTGQNIKVALIDTGVVDVNGLAQANVTIGPDFSFESPSPDLRGRDTNGHGTHLAGIIVGRDDAWSGGNRSRTPDRFVGIAPDAQLVSIKAGSADGSADPSQVIAAINWVIRYNAANPASPIRVVNLAYGTDSDQDYTVDPLAYAAERAWKAGIVVVVAAGNDGWDAAHLSDPAIDPYVISVGASEGVGGAAVPAAYSSEGSSDRTVDLLAPGRSVVSLRDPGSWSDQFNAGGRAGDTLVRGSGTSQATAVVTGAVADLLSQRPWLSPDEVKATLLGTARHIQSSDPTLAGAGLLQLDKALQSKPLEAPQSFDPANGSGSLEAARGSSHVVGDDGTLLTGEQDVFGNNFSADGWVTDAWAGSRWRGDDWTADAWAGSRWRDIAWDADLWAGSRWREDDWTGSRWRDGAWDGSRWRETSWAGSRWRGFGDF